MQPCVPALPAAVTITASRSTAANRSAAPNAVWSIGLPTAMHDTRVMLITFTPRLAMCTTARANVLISPARRTSCGFCPTSGSANPNVCADWRIDTSTASGATPIRPSGPPPGAAAAAAEPAARPPAPMPGLQAAGHPAAEAEVVAGEVAVVVVV